jgi:type I restriction enzyme S subunit
MVYVPIHEDADIGFYSWYMKSECFQSELEKVATGTTNSHVRVTPKETLNWKIAHPPLPEQRRIAEILDTIDEVIQKTEALISKLKAMKQGLLHDLLTRGLDKNGKLRDPKAHPEQFKDSPLGRIPKEWGINPLEKLAEVDRGKFTHRPRNDPRFYGGAYPFVQTGDIAKAEGDILKKYSQTLNNSGSAVSREFPKNTIAITIAANIADTAILGQPMYFPDSIVGAIVRPPNNVRYIELCIRRAKQILNAHAPQSAQKNINLEDLRPLLIPTSTSEEQNRIGDMYDAYSNRVQSEEQYREKLKLQKKGLMHDLLTGKVRVKV